MIEEPAEVLPTGTRSGDTASVENLHGILSQYAFTPTTPRRSPRKHISQHTDLYSAKKEQDGTIGLELLTPSPTKRRLSQDSEEGDVLDNISAYKGSPSPGKKQKIKIKRGFAGPETYAHLHNLQDYLAENLDIIFCGINPGIKSAEIGHHFGNPTNHFWTCLHESGLTSSRIRPEEDYTLPSRFSLGLTNLVDRPTIEQNELSKSELAAGVPAFLSKVARYRPRIVCFVGLGIADIVSAQVLPKATRTSKKSEPENAKPTKNPIGFRPFKLVYPKSENNCSHETLFYAVSSTSGRVVQYQKTEKIEQFRMLKVIIEQLKCGMLDTDAFHSIIA